MRFANVRFPILGFELELEPLDGFVGESYKTMPICLDSDLRILPPKDYDVWLEVRSSCLGRRMRLVNCSATASRMTGV